MLSEWVTTTVAAERLGLTRQRVHQLIEADHFETVERIGNIIVLSKAEVEAFKKKKRPPGRRKKEFK